MQAQDKLTKARAGLVLDQPFFGSLALRLRLREDQTAETAWVDGVTLGFNPQYIDSLTLETTKGLIAHEVMHIACAHHTRRQHRDPGLWNQATDYAINDLLKQAGMVLPSAALTGWDTEYSADDIYAKMPQPKQQGSGQSQQQQGQGQQQGQDQGQGSGQNQGQQPGGDPGGCGEVRDYPGQDGQEASPAEMAQAEQEAKIAAQQAAQQAKAMGSCPAGIARLVEELTQPKIDWREILRRFVEQSARSDYSWTPPNRRFIHKGLYLPSLHNEELGDIVIAMDTSGSIEDLQVAEFASELTAILEEFNATATVIHCDTEVAGVEIFTQDDLPLELHPQGGGGTDFRPPFDWIEENAPQPPAAMIYLTDLECSRFPNEPEYPVLWAHTDQGGETPPFGEVIELT